MPPFDADPADDRTELDLCLEEIKQLQTQRNELLEACEAAEANLSPAYASEHIVMKKLRSAIAKATG